MSIIIYARGFNFIAFWLPIVLFFALLILLIIIGVEFIKLEI